MYKRLTFHLQLNQASTRILIIWQGSLEVNPSVVIGSFSCGLDFAIRTVFVETDISCIFFVFKIGQIQNCQRKRVSYDKLLYINLACSSRTGENWPSVVFVRTSLRSVRTATTSGQYRDYDNFFFFSFERNKTIN